jgi:uncharacterized protein
MLSGCYTKFALPIAVLRFIDLAINEGKLYPSQSLLEQVCDDPDDDKFLACALASGCKLIVSGDKHLLKVSGFGNIEILRPRAFVEKYLT